MKKSTTTVWLLLITLIFHFSTTDELHANTQKGENTSKTFSKYSLIPNLEVSEKNISRFLEISYRTRESIVYFLNTKEPLEHEIILGMNILNMSSSWNKFIFSLRFMNKDSFHIQQNLNLIFNNFSYKLTYYRIDTISIQDKIKYLDAEIKAAISYFRSNSTFKSQRLGKILDTIDEIVDMALLEKVKIISLIKRVEYLSKFDLKYSRERFYWEYARMVQYFDLQLLLYSLILYYDFNNEAEMYYILIEGVQEDLRFFSSFINEYSILSIIDIRNLTKNQLTILYNYCY